MRMTARDALTTHLPATATEITMIIRASKIATATCIITITITHATTFNPRSSKCSGGGGLEEEHAAAAGAPSPTLSPSSSMMMNVADAPARVTMGPTGNAQQLARKAMNHTS